MLDRRMEPLGLYGTDIISIDNDGANSLPVTSFRFPGAFNSQELLVAEAASEWAWPFLLRHDPAAEVGAAKAELAVIVVRLMLDRSRPKEDLALAANEGIPAASLRKHRDIDPAALKRCAASGGQNVLSRAKFTPRSL
jgi:hypothetical protein